MPSCLSPLFSSFRSPPKASKPTAAVEEKAVQAAPSTRLHSTGRGFFSDRFPNTSSIPPPAYSSAVVGLTLQEEKSQALGPEYKVLEDAVSALDKELRELSLDVSDHPEVGWKEFRTHDVCCDFMEKHGFEVTRHACGLKTGWIAKFTQGKGGRTIGFNSEMDALPGIGQACGHNLILIAGIGASLAFAEGLKKSGKPGTVILLGTPAEEVDGGKINMIDAGAYKDMDVCLMLHPAPYHGVGSSLAVSECVVEYEGHTAHAAGAPWEAINAQDAAVLAYSNVSALRQQLHYTYRVHGIITGNDSWVQNVIPGTSKIIFGARTPTLAELKILKKRVEACFIAGASATGCKYKSSWPMEYWDLRNNEALSDVYTGYMKKEHGAYFPEGQDLGGSTDFGNVSYNVPALHPIFQIPCGPGEGNHTIEFMRAARTPEAHQACLDATKGVAIVAWKVLTDDDFAAKVKKEFDEMKRD